MVAARTLPIDTWLRPNAFKEPVRKRPGVGIKRCMSTREYKKRLDPRALWPRSRDFESRFRLTPEMVEFLAGEFYRSSAYTVVGDDPDGQGRPIPVFHKVCLALRFMATGASYSCIRDTQGGCSRSAISRAVSAFVLFLVTRSKDYIKFPKGYAMQESAVRFAEKFKFDTCLGCIDGTYIPIKKPVDNEHAYVCRHGYHALNTLVVTDAKQKFTYVESGTGGSHHDMAVFELSDFGQLVTHTDRMKNYFLLADSGYALTPQLMTPFKGKDVEALTDWERRYQHRHTSARSSVERTIGQLKTRWRCLAKNGGGVVKMDPLEASMLVRACCVLHNMCVDWGLRALCPKDAYDPDMEERIQRLAAARFLKALRDVGGIPPPPRRRRKPDQYRAGVKRRNEIMYRYFGGPRP